MKCRRGGAGHELEILQWLKVERGYLKEQEWKIENQRTNIEVGDVLLTIVGSIGRIETLLNMLYC